MPVPKLHTYPNDIQLICFVEYSARVSAVELLGGCSNKKLILLHPIKSKHVHLPVKAGCHGKVTSTGMRTGRKLQQKEELNTRDLKDHLKDLFI